jgi:hypothetical protein
MAETPVSAGPTVLTTSSQTIVTAGAGGTWTLLRKMIVTNTTDAPVNVTIGIGTSNTDTAAKRIFHNVTVQPGAPLIEDGFAVLDGGASPELLYALMPSASSPVGGLNIYVATVTGP